MKNQIQLLAILCVASNLTALDKEERKSSSQTVLHQMVNKFQDDSAQIAAIIQRLNKNDIQQLLTTKNSSGRTPLQEAEHCRIHRNPSFVKSLGHHTLEELEDQFRQQDRQKMHALIKQIFNNESEDPCRTSSLGQYITKVGNTAKTVACNIVNGGKKEMTEKLKEAERFAELHHTKIEHHIEKLNQDFGNLNA